MEFETKYNVGQDTLRSVYEFYNKFEGLVGHEITFTVAPGRCGDINEVKKKIMRLCVGRMIHSKPVAFILTRENHENGWPHIHGVGWWASNADNALTLSGGRMFVEQREAGKKFSSKYWMYNELGRTQIDNLRNEPYVQQKDGKEVPYGDWLEYICKEQGTKWREANAVVKSQIKVENLFSKTKVETYID